MADELKMDNVSPELMGALLVPPEKGGEDEKKAAPAEDTPAIDEADDELPVNEELGVNEEDHEDEDSPEEDYQEEADYEDEEGDDEDIRDTFEVMVDGELQRPTLDELKASYSGNGAIQKRLQEATETRKQAEIEAQQANQARHVYSQKLAQLDAIIHSATPQEPDRSLLDTDPQAYYRAAAEVEDRRRQVQAIAAEREREDQERIQHENEALQRHLAAERDKAVAAIPAISDPTKAQELGAAWFKTLSDYGFTQEEFSQVSDHRILRVINDLTEARTQLASEPKKREPRRKRRRQVKTSVRPNASTAHTRSDQRKQRMDAVNQRARKTGLAEDVAATLIVPSN
jgi:hypothetical protein